MYCHCHNPNQNLSSIDNGSIEDTSTTENCQCCLPTPSNNKVKGKFGVAYRMETPNGKCSPCGWEIEFNDTPSQVDYNCKKMMQWVSAPPVGYQYEEIPSTQCQCCCNCTKETVYCCCCCCKKEKKKKPSSTCRSCRCRHCAGAAGRCTYCCCAQHDTSSSSDSSFMCAYCIKKKFCKCCGRIKPNNKRKQHTKRSTDSSRPSKNLHSPKLSNETDKRNERTRYTISDSNGKKKEPDKNGTAEPKEEIELRNVEYTKNNDDNVNEAAIIEEDKLAMKDMPSGIVPTTKSAVGGKKINRKDLLRKIKQGKKKQNEIIAGGKDIKK